ncbi:uncharacterized protein BP5553_10345 [Venustampulla echinocandica]|uniref:Zn(2)-C6 fungal-type domain-containing protein n=1 Tax=Venustampulla echinocandica TaxID=2656787 RepID=A0A370T9W9_9HELO|nr:uncharacterized protein BP5553_10345 [Venustampulla echinocandica]RDL30467.1 hypothetical protein BP5553_10345 [Venustampulla echinocandica]
MRVRANAPLSASITANESRICRKRKIKCDGRKPSCSGCHAALQTCIYRSPANYRFVFKTVGISGPAKKQKKAVQEDGPSALAPIQSSTGIPPACSQVERGQLDLGAQQINTQMPLTNPSPPLRIPFFRWFGPTGIAPGYKRIFVQIKDGTDHQELQSPSSSTPAAFSSLPSDYQQTTKRGDLDQLLFEPDDNLTPICGILFPLLETFFEYYGCHFPFYSKDSFIDLAREKKVPALLLNSMCALAARFSALPVFKGKPAYVRGELFADKAKHLLVPLLNLPSYDVVASILMIAWMEMATCHDVGIWMYTGMAVRMAEDMGMHKKSTLSPAEPESGDDRRLYWAINLLDHIICFATGRPLTTRREYVDVALPAETLVQTEPFELASPFPSMIRVIQIQGLVNGEIGILPEQPLDLTPQTRQRLLQYGNDLVAHYASMHPSLAFDAPNFRAHAIKGQGGTFLLLHLWFNSVLISLHRPGLRFGQQNHRDTNFLSPSSRQISLSTARTTSSILSLADLVDIKSIFGSPFIDQAVEMAGLVFVAELRIPTPMPSIPDVVGLHEAGLGELSHEAHYVVCLRTLRLLMIYWRGIGWILTALEQKYKGVKDTDPGAANVDPYSEVALSDRKMIKRLLRHVESSNNKNHNGAVDGTQDSTIGIAVAGTTNSAAKRMVTVIESSDPRYSQQTFTVPLLDDTVASSRDVSDLESELVWTSWLGNDSGLWNLGFEHFDQFDNFDNLGHFDTST